MTRTRPHLRIPLELLMLALLSAGVPARAYADPILVTSGLVSMRWDASSTSFTLAGEGFSAGGGGIGGGIGPIGFEVGDVVTIQGSVGGHSLGSGPATVGGQAFGRVHYGGLLTLMAQPFVAGDVPTLSFFTSPFTMTGRLLGFADEQRSTTPLFDVQLVGQGTVSIGAMQRIDNFFVNTGGLQFRFDATPAPIPEPASMILLSTGLGVLAMRRRRSGKDPRN